VARGPGQTMIAGWKVPSQNGRLNPMAMAFPSNRTMAARRLPIVTGLPTVN